MERKLKGLISSLPLGPGMLRAFVDEDLTPLGFLKAQARGALVEALSWEGVSQFLSKAHMAQVPYRVLGLGSNQILEDARDFVYLKLAIEWRDKGVNVEDPYFEFPASIPLARLTSLAIRHKLKGWEVFTGIPATLGGAIFMNAGTSLGEMAEIIQEVRFFDCRGRPHAQKIEKKHFSYRKNHFLQKGEVIISALVKNQGTDERIPKIIKDYLAYRKQTQPLAEKTCGCLFKNRPGPVPTGRYMELVGLKGLRHGNMEISSKHANFLVHRGGESKREIVKFMAKIRSLLYDYYGHDFEEEIQ